MRSDARKAMQEKRLAEQQVAGCPLTCLNRLAASCVIHRAQAAPSGASGGVDELAGLLGAHRYRDVLGNYEIAPYYRHFGCSCGWEQDIAGMNGWRSWVAAHAVHVAEVIAREWLPERERAASEKAWDRLSAWLDDHCDSDVRTRVKYAAHDSNPYRRRADREEHGR